MQAQWVGFAAISQSPLEQGPNKLHRVWNKVFPHSPMRAHDAPTIIADQSVYLWSLITVTPSSAVAFNKDLFTSI